MVSRFIEYSLNLDIRHVQIQRMFNGSGRKPELTPSILIYLSFYMCFTVSRFIEYSLNLNRQCVQIKKCSINLVENQNET